MITLACKGCAQTRDLPDGSTIEGKPALTWFAGRRELCKDCFGRVGEPGAKVRRDAPDTSRAAANRIAPKAGTKRWIVLDAILATPDGLTDEQMQLSIPMSPNTQRPRRVELVEQGLIKDSGQRRHTSTGDAAIVWVAQ